MSLKQVQKLVMTPELRQAITILQLPTVELLKYVENELLVNPVLEETEAGETGDMASGSDSRAPQGGEVDWERYFGDGTDLGYVREPRDPDPEDGPGDTVRWEPTLADQLRLQLHIASGCSEVRRIGEYLLGCMDENGFISGDGADIAEALGVSQEAVESVRRLIQGFEPVGVGSRDLTECLEVQIDASDASETTRKLARRIVLQHLEDVARGRVSYIAQALGATPQDVQEAIDLIRSLNPRPGANYQSGPDVRYIVPDVFIERVDGDYIVLLNDTAVPRLVVSRFYRSMLSDRGADESAKEFIREKLNSALWLIRSIEQRRSTIQRVTESIVRFQRDFLDYGIKRLHPLTLRQVAQDIGVHESTVSRATVGKYAQTPRGTFELRFFFGSGVSTSEGDAASAASIKKLISEMITREDQKAPLSDREIAEALGRQGICISRRTVAKYREEMAVPSSAKRKRY
jgi:RNA polymerase sigma-54 factor